MNTLNTYSVECYFCNKETGESGWDIEIVEVEATNKAEAAAKIKAMPHFDCFIEWGFDKFN